MRQPSNTTSPAQRGFLLVELLIGMVIVAMIMLGAAAIMSATAQGWSDQDVTRSTQMQANQTYIRVQNAMQGAQYVGYPGASGTGSEIFFWQNDNVHNYLTAQGYNGPYVSDPYVGEMALIQYDATTQTLWLYYVPESAATTAYSQQPTPLTLADINESSEATWFSQQPFVTKQALGGPGTQPNDGTRLLVSSFQVYVSSLGSSTELPVIEYSIGFTRSDGTSLTLYNSTTVRSPTTQPE